MKCKYHYFFLFCSMLLVSCSTVRWVNVDRLYPAEISLPEQVRRVAVVNNQVNVPKNSDYYLTVLFADAQKVVDSLAVNLANTNYFDEVVICDSSVVSPDATLHGDYHLKPHKVDELSSLLDVDMLVSVELAMFTVKGENYYSPTGDVYSVVKLYLPGREMPLDTLIKKQRVGWDNHPTKEEVMETLVEWAAMLPVPSIVPQWKKVDFPYYTGRCVEMRDADACLRKNDWDGALELWKPLLEDKDWRKRMEANLNVAVWHEIHDDSIATAREYAVKALELANSKLKKDKSGVPVRLSYDYELISRYMHDMEKRGKDLSRVKTQMLRFSDILGEEFLPE